MNKAMSVSQSLRKQWQWVAGKAKHTLTRVDEDGNPDEGFTVVVRGRGYAAQGWEVLVCRPLCVKVVANPQSLDGAMCCGEALYRDHYDL